MNLSGENQESIVDINVAPLVDVILVLLIIFMATAPLIQRRTLNVNVPKVANSEPKATQALNVSINEKNEILLGEQVLSTEELTYQLGSMLRADPILHVVLMADQTISYGRVAEVLDLIRGVGVKKIALEVGSKAKK